MSASRRGRRRRSRHRRGRARGPALIVTTVAIAAVVAAVAGWSVLPEHTRAAVQARITPPATAQPNGPEPGPPVARPNRDHARPAPELTPAKPSVKPSVKPKAPATPGNKTAKLTEPPKVVPLEPAAPPANATGPGTFTVAPGKPAPPKAPKLVRYTVEVELGLTIAAPGAAAFVEQTLNDKRSWGAAGYTFQRAATGGDLRILLATPGTVDKLCAPLETQGEVSCRNEGRVVLNARRWLLGAASYGTDILNYRRYVVNHEVGHFLGRGHLKCPGPGRYAPVMVQQTLGLGGCRPNPWPILSLQN